MSPERVGAHRLCRRCILRGEHRVERAEVDEVRPWHKLVEFAVGVEDVGAAVREVDGDATAAGHRARECAGGGVVVLRSHLVGEGPLCEVRPRHTGDAVAVDHFACGGGGALYLPHGVRAFVEGLDVAEVAHFVAQDGVVEVCHLRGGHQSRFREVGAGGHAGIELLLVGGGHQPRGRSGGGVGNAFVELLLVGGGEEARGRGGSHGERGLRADVLAVEVLDEELPRGGRVADTLRPGLGPRAYVLHLRAVVGGKADVADEALLAFAEVLRADVVAHALFDVVVDRANLVLQHAVGRVAGHFGRGACRPGRGRAGEHAHVVDCPEGLHAGVLGGCEHAGGTGCGVEGGDEGAAFVGLALRVVVAQADAYAVGG